MYSFQCDHNTCIISQPFVFPPTYASITHLMHTECQGVCGGQGRDELAPITLRTCIKLSMMLDWLASKRRVGARQGATKSWVFGSSCGSKAQCQK